MNTVLIIVGAVIACTATYWLGFDRGHRRFHSQPENNSTFLQLAALRVLVGRVGGRTSIPISELGVKKNAGVLFEIDREADVVRLTNHEDTPEEMLR